MGLLFSAEQVSDLGEEAVSDILNAESFPIINSNLVLVHISLWFDLNGVGVNLPVPEPLRTPELNKLRVSRGNVSQVLKKSFPFGAVLNTESNLVNDIPQFPVICGGHRTVPRVIIRQRPQRRTL